MVRITLHIAACASLVFIGLSMYPAPATRFVKFKVERGLQMSKDSRLLAYAERM